MITSFLFWIIKDCLFLLGYISGRQSFCKPLNPEEERAALLRMREGDDEARQTLIEHNMRLIVHIARKYKVPGCTFDDLISIGAIGLIKAVRSYDMDSGTSLSTYAARCIENAMLSPMPLSRIKKQSSSSGGLFALQRADHSVQQLFFLLLRTSQLLKIRKYKIRMHKGGPPGELSFSFLRFRLMCYRCHRKTSPAHLLTSQNT